MSASVPNCHVRGPREVTSKALTSWGFLIAPVPLFQPRVSADVVAVRLPEARMLLFLQTDPTDPLRALPEVEVRDEKTDRAAVLGVQRLTVELVGNPGLAAGDVVEREVGRVAAVGEDRRELRGRVDPIHEGVDRNALPAGVELRPLGDAVDVLGDAFRGERGELLPCPAPGFVDLAFDGEGPLVDVDARRGPGRQHGPVGHDVLPGRNARAGGCVAPLSAEAAGDEPHSAQLSRYFKWRASGCSWGCARPRPARAPLAVEACTCRIGPAALSSARTIRRPDSWTNDPRPRLCLRPPASARPRCRAPSSHRVSSASRAGRRSRGAGSEARSCRRCKRSPVDWPTRPCTSGTRTTRSGWSAPTVSPWFHCP